MAGQGTSEAIAGTLFAWRRPTTPRSAFPTETQPASPVARLRLGRFGVARRAQFGGGRGVSAAHCLGRRRRPPMARNHLPDRGLGLGPAAAGPRGQRTRLDVDRPQRPAGRGSGHPPTQPARLRRPRSAGLGRCDGQAAAAIVGLRQRRKPAAMSVPLADGGRRVPEPRSWTTAATGCW